MTPALVLLLAGTAAAAEPARKPAAFLEVPGRAYRVLTPAEFDRRMLDKKGSAHPQKMTPEGMRADLEALEKAVGDVWRMHWVRGPRLVPLREKFEAARDELPQEPTPLGRFRALLEGLLSQLEDDHLYLMEQGDELGRISDPQAPVTWKRVDKEFGWIRIDRFPEPQHPFGKEFGDLIDKAFLELGDTRGLVLDFRGHAGGDPNQADRLFDHLASTTVFLYAEVVRRSPAMAFYLGPDTLSWYQWSEGSEFSEPTVVTYDPKPEAKYAGKVLALADRNTTSAGEYILAALKDSGLAEVAGERTAGGSGSVVPIELPRSRLVAAIPVQHTLRRDGTSIQRAGISPDHRLDPKAEDAEKKAVELLRKQR